MRSKIFKISGILSVIIACAVGFQNCGGGSGGGGGNPNGLSGPKYVFVTSQEFKGNLGGLAGADGICNTYAQAGGLSGTFKAWLSDSSTLASARIANVGPWYLVGTNIVAANNVSSFAISPNVMIDRDQNGNIIGAYPFDAWTGTAVGGVPGYNCSDWTVDVIGVPASNPTNIGTGLSIAPANIWFIGSTTCNATLRLVCIQQ